MATIIDTDITIDRPIETVWHVLTDFSSYPQWNDFICSLEGKAALGARLKAAIAPEPGKTMRFKPTIVTCDPHKELTWLGRFLIPGLFDGKHCFQLTPLDGNRTLLRQSEHFSGLLVPLVSGSIISKTKAGFQRMNTALKQRCEG